jgi:hypothetical protein
MNEKEEALNARRPDAQGQSSKQAAAKTSFAKRLQIAADRSNTIPPTNMGRFTHIQRQLAEHYGFDLSRETVRKWFVGEALPRPDKMLALSRVLKVDEGWLAVGSSPSSLPPETSLVQVHDNAAINLIIGMMGINGVSCAQPDEDEAGPGDSPFFYAIINGRQWRIFVSLGQANSDRISFRGPTGKEHVTTLGIVAHTVTDFSVFQFTPELIARNGQSHRGIFELDGVLSGRDLKFGSDKVSALKDFRSLTK